MNPALFDPDDWRTESLPAVLRLLHRVYLYAACRVTGHAAHALNGVLVWLLIGGPLWLPLSWFWVGPMVFYTDRDGRYLLSGDGEVLDHAGDVVWVYAVGIALWCPWWALTAWMVPTLAVQVAYWMRPAPGWMPRESLLLGHG